MSSKGEICAESVIGGFQGENKMDGTWLFQDPLLFQDWQCYVLGNCHVPRMTYSKSLVLLPGDWLDGHGH
jgi:hypothetical protein